MMRDPEPDTTSAPAPQRRSRKGSVNTAVLVAGIPELVSTVFSELMNPDQATAAISKAKKQPAVKAMLAAVKAKAGPRGPAACRSAYHVFLQDFLGHTKAAGHEVTLMQAAGIWSVLPSETKSDLKGLYTAIMKSYNEQLAAGTAVSLSEVTQTYLHDNDLEPVDHLLLWENFKGAAAQATLDKAATAAAAAATSKDGKGQLSIAAGKSAAAAPSNVVTGKRGGQDKQQVQQQSKKQKTEKDRESSKHQRKKEKKAKRDKKKKSKRDSKHNTAAPTEAPSSPSF